MPYYKNVLVISDNSLLIKEFYCLVEKMKGFNIGYMCSHGNTDLLHNTLIPVKLIGINLKEDWKKVIQKYDLVISIHCKQLFPVEMVKAVKCINVHPGYNPFNRGWFPQVFSILNHLPFGATIHEIDEQLDHGAIIAQKLVTSEIWETSIDIYNKIVRVEVELLQEFLPAILNNSYKTIIPKEEGNINLKKDFHKLCQLDLNEQLTMGQAIDRLRALTHGTYKNAWFMDPKTQKRVFVRISFDK